MNQAITPVLIGGIEYVPATHAHQTAGARLGVAITTRNRPDMLTTTLDHVRKHTPGAVIVVVDDASTTPVSDATYRFNKQAGIARAKNKCIELLMDAGCDELFLLDDDCYPIADGWTDLYVDNPEPHLCYLFKDLDSRRPLATPATLYDDGRTFAYEHPRGCLLYLNRSVVEACGGERTIFGIWGHEHVEYSLRIHHTGLTTNAFQDAAGSNRYIYSVDEHYAKHPNFQRSVPAKERAAALERNDAILAEMRHTTTGYVEYRDLPNVVITTLLTKVPDPQRGKRMEPNLSLFDTWTTSIRGARPVVLADEAEPGDVVVRVTSGLNPYLQRWVALYHYLRDNRTGWTWFTDGTDVEMLQQPWDRMRPGVLYVGHEPTVVDIPWMRKHHKPYAAWIDEHADLQLLNAGVVGGDHATMLAFAHDMVREIFARGPKTVDGDMAALNYVARLPQWRERTVWGSRWVTAFKANEQNEWSVWRHK